MSFEKVKTIWSIRFTHSRAESETAEFGRNARSDWQLVCFVFLFLNVIAIGVSVFMYQGINNGEIFLVDKKETLSAGTFDRFKLEKTVAFFEDKKARFGAFQQKPLMTIDPFIPGMVPKR